MASDSEASIGEVDEGIMHRALENYLENNSNESSFSPEDFYFDAFVGAFCQATIEGKIPPRASMSIFTVTQNFLSSSAQYQTAVINKIMQNWQAILSKKGAF